MPGMPIRRCDASRGKQIRMWNWPGRVVIRVKADSVARYAADSGRVAIPALRKGIS
jgi:hypothetical protein